MKNDLTTAPLAHLSRELPPVPQECIQWCRSQSVAMTLFEDSASVDLDWWNSRLRQADIPIVLLGRGPDGELVDHGRAEITRIDLWKQARFSQHVDDSPFAWDDRVPGALAPTVPPHLLADPGHLVTTLYLVAAWANAHPGRRIPLRFYPFSEHDPETGRMLVHPSLLDAVRSQDQPGFAFDQLLARGQHRTAYAPRKIRGLGWQLAAYLLSILSVRPGARRVVPMGPAALNMLVRCGWHEFSAAKNPNSWDYLRYQEAVRIWAEQAETSPELVEMWLTQTWNRLEAPLSAAQPDLWAVRW